MNCYRNREKINREQTLEEFRLQPPSMRGKIIVGAGSVKERLPSLLAGQKNFVVTDRTVYALYGDFFKTQFPNTEIFVLGAGEENKTADNLLKLLARMSEVGLHRSSRIFAVGGGVIGDLVGLAASLYMRGISLVQIPTTLLAQVDSSVGGKTAVNLGGVKNIVGAFYQPKEVIVDPLFLKTLPDREIKCGLGEIVKYAALNEGIFYLLDGKTGEEMVKEEFLLPLITKCIAHKARVVEMDEKETGERKSLNVGHTTGHAIELYAGLSHGESVLIGMAFETEMAIEKQVCDKAYGERLLRIVREALTLEPNAFPDLSAVELWAEKAKSDKKNTDDGKINLAVAKSKGEWTTLAMSYTEYCDSLKKAVAKL